MDYCTERKDSWILWFLELHAPEVLSAKARMASSRVTQSLSASCIKGELDGGDDGAEAVYALLLLWMWCESIFDVRV